MPLPGQLGLCIKVPRRLCTRSGRQARLFPLPRHSVVGRVVDGDDSATAAARHLDRLGGAGSGVCGACAGARGSTAIGLEAPLDNSWPSLETGNKVPSHIVLFSLLVPSSQQAGSGVQDRRIQGWLARNQHHHLQLAGHGGGSHGLIPVNTVNAVTTRDLRRAGPGHSRVTRHPSGASAAFPVTVCETQAATVGVCPHHPMSPERQ